MPTMYHEAIYKFVLREEPREPLTEQHKRCIEFAVTSLDERTQRVMLERFGENKTYNEIGRKERVTGSRIRQILVKAGRNLRKPAVRRLVQYGFEGPSSPRGRNWAMQSLVSEFEKRLSQLTTINHLKLNSRTKEFLKRSDITSIDQLKSLSEEEIQEIEGIGIKSLIDIQNALNEFESANHPTLDLDDMVVSYIDALLSEKEELFEVVQADLHALRAIKYGLLAKAMVKEESPV